MELKHLRALHALRRLYITRSLARALDDLTIASMMPGSDMFLGQVWPKMVKFEYVANPGVDVL